MPIIWSKKLGDNGELAVWHITEVADELYNKLQLNNAEKAFYDSLQSSKRNMHWLGSRVLLRTLLKTTEYIDCQLDQNNKPYLVSSTEYPFLSLPYCTIALKIATHSKSKQRKF